MARALFICEVVLNAKGRAYPATEDVRESLATGTFPAVWTITTFQDSRRVAIGLAEVTAPQLAALQADTRIRAISLAAGWQTSQWGSVQTAVKTSWINFMNARGLQVAGIGDTTTLKELIDTLGGRMRAGRTLMHLEMELAMNFGV